MNKSWISFFAIPVFFINPHYLRGKESLISLIQLFTQVVVIFLLMLLGALIRKLGFLHAQSINDLTNITLYFLSPLVIIKGFEQTFSTSRRLL